MAKKLKILFDDQEVTDLYRASCLLVNSGREVLSDISLNWRLEGGKKLLDVGTRPLWEGDGALKITSHDEADNGILLAVKVPFLNPGDDVNVTAHVAGVVSKQVISCRHPGLSVRLRDGPYIRNRTQVIREIFASSSLTTLLAALATMLAATAALPLLESLVGGEREIVRPTAP